MPLISLQGLTKRYPGGVVALDGLTLDLEPGIIGLVGANGAGKSTLLKILLGLLPPTSGTAKVMDRDVVSQGLDIRQFVGYMPEHDCLPPDLSATDFGGYSTGMKQRVKLAQALVHDPRLLLLDEPTNGLDPAGRDEMLALVKRTGTEFGIAVIVASHLLGEIERVSQFLVAIDAGRLLRAAPIAEFTERTGILAVEVEEGHERLHDALVRRGLAATLDGRIVLVPLDDERPYDLVRDEIVGLDLALVRLEQRRKGLEDLFRDEVPA